MGTVRLRKDSLILQNPTGATTFALNYNNISQTVGIVPDNAHIPTDKAVADYVTAATLNPIVHTLTVEEDGANYSQLDVNATGSLTVTSVGTAPKVVLPIVEVGNAAGTNLIVKNGGVDTCSVALDAAGKVTVTTNAAHPINFTAPITYFDHPICNYQIFTENYTFKYAIPDTVVPLIWIVQGMLIILHIPTFSAVCGTNTTIRGDADTLNIGFRPNVTTHLPLLVREGALETSLYSGRMILGAADAGNKILLYRGAGDVLFTVGQTVGVTSTTVTYTTNCS